MKCYLAITLLILFGSAIATADTLSDALSAKQRGDFTAAYPLWQSLAEGGDHKAMVELGLMHHQGQGGPVAYDKAMEWYLKAYNKNGDALNNIGVMYRDGLGVKVNRKIAYILFLTIHMTGMGNQATVSRANRNLRREVEEASTTDKQEAVCYTMEYVKAFIESKGTLEGIPNELRASPERKRIRDFNWWLPGEVGTFACPENT